MIQISGLDFSYYRDKSVLEHIEFIAQKGQCTAILGNNGAGKSTLLKCINRILEPRGGVIRLDGDEIKSLKRVEIAKRMAYVPQRNTGDRVTVYDAVLLGRKPHIRLEPGKEDFRIVESALRRMNLLSFAPRYIDELSGGEMQRVMLARALAQRPRVLLLDEPTGNLDLYHQYEVLFAIREIAAKEQIIVILVIHDLNLALRYCDRFVLLKDHRVFACGGHEVMTPEQIGEVYGIPVSVRETNGVTTVIPYPPPDRRRMTRGQNEEGSRVK